MSFLPVSIGAMAAMVLVIALNKFFPAPPPAIVPVNGIVVVQCEKLQYIIVTTSDGEAIIASRGAVGQVRGMVDLVPAHKRHVIKLPDPASGCPVEA